MTMNKTMLSQLIGQGLTYQVMAFLLEDLEVKVRDPLIFFGCKHL